MKRTISKLLRLPTPEGAEALVDKLVAAHSEEELMEMSLSGRLAKLFPTKVVRREDLPPDYKPWDEIIPASPLPRRLGEITPSREAAEALAARNRARQHSPSRRVAVAARQLAAKVTRKP